MKHSDWEYSPFQYPIHFSPRLLLQSPSWICHTEDQIASKMNGILKNLDASRFLANLCWERGWFISPGLLPPEKSAPESPQTPQK